MTTEIAARKQGGRPFKPGQSGNPAGRPKGARNRATLAAEALLDGEAEALTRTAIRLALAGDPVALRLCLERILPPRRDRPLTFNMPPVSTPADVAQALAAIASAVAEGKITPSEAAGVAALIEAFRLASTEAAQSSVGPANLTIRFVPAEPGGELKD